MAGLNKATLIGNLGKDPEVRVLDGGKKMAKLTLATTDSYKNAKGEKVDTTEWHNVTFWGGLVDVIEKYCKKGDTVFVEGKIQTTPYNDKDGNKKYNFGILGQNLLLLGNKSRTIPHAEAATASAGYYNDDASDDLPF